MNPSNLRNILWAALSATIVFSAMALATNSFASPTMWDCRTVVNDFSVGNNTYLTGDVCQRFESTNDDAQGVHRKLLA